MGQGLQQRQHLTAHPLAHQLPCFDPAEDLARTAADQLVLGVLEARRVAEARGWDVEERAAEEAAELRRLLGLAACGNANEGLFRGRAVLPSVCSLVHYRSVSKGAH